MGYDERFKHADDVIEHLDTVVPTVTDPLLAAKYVGFVAVVGVTVYELAIKDIFVSFGDKKNKVFGTFAASHFKRINGQIKLGDLSDRHVASFGDKYLNRFKRRLTERADSYLRENRRDIKSSYNNIVLWRHAYAHQGRINANATYTDAVQAYKDGKEVVHCLASCMRL